MCNWSLIGISQLCLYSCKLDNRLCTIDEWFFLSIQLSENALELERKKESNGIYLFNFIVGKAINFNSFIFFFFFKGEKWEIVIFYCCCCCWTFCVAIWIILIYLSGRCIDDKLKKKNSYISTLAEENPARIQHSTSCLTDTMTLESCTVRNYYEVTLAWVGEISLDIAV